MTPAILNKLMILKCQTGKLPTGPLMCTHLLKFDMHGVNYKTFISRACIVQKVGRADDIIVFNKNSHRPIIRISTFEIFKFNFNMVFK